MTVKNFIINYKNALIQAPFLYRLLVSFVAGTVLSFTQAPHNLWPLLFLCFGSFYILFAHVHTKRQVFSLSFSFFFGYFVTGLSWIGNALLVEGNEYKWVWPLAVIALPMALSLLSALHMLIVHAFLKNKRWVMFLGFCTLLALSEWTRGHAFTGFPWNLYGYSWISVLPIAQSVSLIGPYVLTFLTIFWSSLGGYCFCVSKLERYHFYLLLVGALSFIGFYSYGAYQLSSSNVEYHEDVSLTLVQPNIAQENKWKADQLGLNFEKHIQLSKSVSNDQKRRIIIWPETALPPTFLNDSAVNQRIYSIMGVNDILLTGALSASENTKTKAREYHNALLLWSPEHRAKQLYSKSHLVPFGEYIPFQKYIPLPTVTSFSGFHKGDGAQTIKIDSLPSFSPLICYEVIFPQNTVSASAPRPDFILTITNDGWYGDSAGPYQHFTQARFRAIERGLPVVRVANTGISGVIDPYGRIVKKADLMREATIISLLPKGASQP